jgi:hypothetical protein
LAASPSDPVNSRGIAPARKHLIDHVQEALPSEPIRNRKPLKHNEAVQVLGKHGIANILREPLMQSIRSITLLVLGTFRLQLAQ